MTRTQIRQIGIILFFLWITVFFTNCSSSPKQQTAPGEEPPTAEETQPVSEVDDEPAPPSEEVKSEPKKPGDYQKLKTAVRSGNADQIRDEAAKILSSHPEDPTALNTLALYYLRKNKPGAAKILLARAFEKNSDVAALYNNLGVIELGEGDTTAAIANFKTALRLDERQVSAAGNLGSIYVAGGEYNKSRSLLEIAYKANRANAAIANNYAITLRANKDYSRAAKIYEEVIKANPRDVNAHLNYAILLIDYMSKPKDGLALVSKLKFLETENRSIIARANALEKKAKAEIK